MSQEIQILGIVKEGKFFPVDQEHMNGEQIRLTSIPIQAAMTPEAGELELNEHEGKAIMVAGIDNGDWLFSAKVIDKAGPILTEVVKKIFCLKDS